jgi:hypothetical protein
MMNEGENPQKIVEIIPLNPCHPDHEGHAAIHFGRIRQVVLSGKSVDHIYLINFSTQESDEKYQNFRESLIGALKFAYDGKPTEISISKDYPEIIPEISKIRSQIEQSFPDAQVYLNLTPLQLHFHAFFLRDGLCSKKYDFFPYEILNFSHKKFDIVIIPEYHNLDLLEWDILNRIVELKNSPMSLKQFLHDEAFQSTVKEIKFPDQALRKRLNRLVDQGLMQLSIHANGEKKYKLKQIGLNRPET